MLRVYIQNSHQYKPEMIYTWNLLCGAVNIPTEIIDAAETADFTIGSDSSFDLVCSGYYFKNIIDEKNYDFRELFTDGPILAENKRPDYLATIFFLVNSIQEYHSTNTDELGRFQYKNSYQFHFKNITDNYVHNLIKNLFSETKKLSSLLIKDKKTKILLSHDIDSLYGSFLQDGKWAFKNFSPTVALSLLTNAVLSKPHWFNIDKIMDIESKHDFKSTFFWLVNKGKINARETNSDYSIYSKKLINTIHTVKERGFENGLHKSISKQGFNEELKKLPVESVLNRNHYLKFSLPQHYQDIENSQIECDASLGFAEHFGFRNSYGLPFKPYDLQTRKPFNFTEFPLHCMDGTFQRYLKIPVDKTAENIIGFIDKNKFNSVLSILWHNTFFTDYKYGGYLQEYKKILAYLYENKFEVSSYKEILSEY